MLKRGLVLGMLFAVTLHAAPLRNKRPRYIFMLPDGYIGWVQIIFNDPAAPALPMKDGGYVIEVPESGLARTSDLHVHDSKSVNEFYYHSSPTTGRQELRILPAEYVLPGDSQGGFSVMDTGGRGDGYSWFIFIGPPSIRSKVPLADWDKVVEDWWKVHGNRRVSAPIQYPSPGRMSLEATSRQ